MARYKIDGSYQVTISGVMCRIGPGEVQLADSAVAHIKQYFPGVYARLQSLDEPVDSQQDASQSPIEDTGDTDFEDLKSAIAKALDDNELDAFYSSSGKPKPSYFSRVLGRPVPRSRLEDAFAEVMSERGDAGE